MIKYIGNRADLTQADPQECLEWCLKQSLLVLDTETTRKYPKGTYDETVYRAGLDPKLSNIIMLQIGNQERKYIIDARVIDIRFLKPVLEGPILKILHNAKFDAKHLLELDLTLYNVWDTMIIERVLHNGWNYSYSLEAVAKRYNLIQANILPELFDLEEQEEDLEFNLLDGAEEKVFVDKSIRTQFIEWGDKPFTIDQINYGASDLDLPLKIYNKQKQGITVNGELYLPLKGFAVENETVLALAQVEREGIKVDIDGWLALEKFNLEKYREKQKILNDFVVKNFPNYTKGVDIFSNEETCGIDWQSTTQVIKFFRGLNICPKEKSKQTGKIEWTVGAKALFKLLTNENKEKFQNSETIEFKGKQDTQALILNFLVFKKYQMLTTTFGSKYLRWVHPITGKIHTNFRQYMNTGRMSSSSPNGQNIPNGKEWRKLFISEEGEDMVAVDFESQEIRYLSVLAGLQNMKDFFIIGDDFFLSDFHSWAATQVFRIVRNDPTLVITKKTHPNERTANKKLTFGINYGKGAFSVAQELGIEESEAIKFIDGFLDGFPGLRENFAKRKKAATDNGWIEISPYTKKRYFFPEFKEMKESEAKAKSFYTEEHNEKSKKINVALKGNLTKEQRANLLEQKQALKDELYAKHPELGPLWKRVMTLKGKLERRALNFGIQGGCSEMTKIALCLMVRAKIRVILIIHDEFLAVCKEPESEYIGGKIKELMVSAGSRYSNDVKFTGDAATGKYWIH